MNKTPQAGAAPTLREILALPVAVPIGEHQVQIRPMGWMLFAEAVEPLMPVLQELPLVFAGYETMTREDKVAAWGGVVLSARKELNQFAALASGFPAEEVGQLTPTQFVDLLMGLFELNADFFVQSLPALLERMAGRIEQLKPRMEAALAKAKALAPSAASTTSSSA